MAYKDVVLVHDHVTNMAALGHRTLQSFVLSVVAVMSSEIHCSDSELSDL